MALWIVDGDMLWRQFELPINALRDALVECPDALWREKLWEDEPGQWVAQGFGSFWYVSYHALFWLDLYLTGAEEGFAPPAPFDLVEMNAGEVLPRVYSREELLGYVEICRARCRSTIAALTSEGAGRTCHFPWGDVAFGELLIYTLRHVQEHAAQLHLFIHQRRPRAAA